MIDWSKLLGNARKTFEDFCYVLAANEFENLGKFTNVDDSGGGDGVEFYLQLPNGDEWGWQAKFFFPNLRLNVSGRKSQMQRSLDRALEVHPSLSRLYICTPGEFTTNENNWFEGEFTDRIPENRQVDLIHWGEGDFHRLIFKPINNGIRNYFFGEREINFDFFKNNFEEILSIVGDIYIPELHSIDEIYEAI